MKSYLFLLTVIISMFSNTVKAQCQLDIEIQDLKNNTGNIMLQLFDANEVVFTQEISKIFDRKCSFTIKNLKQGKYAVRYYHDENVNGNMETNLVGKPTEGYGFSNNVTGKFGPPPFEKWLFEITGSKKIILKPSY
jgi:uncharacterized protein (DUF2141 family)